MNGHLIYLRQATVKPMPEVCLARVQSNSLQQSNVASLDQLFYSGTLFPFVFVAAPLKMVFPNKGSLFFPGSLNN